MIGVLKWFDPVKHYGFIRGADNRDYFLHGCQVLNPPSGSGDVQTKHFELAKDQAVAFDVEPSMKPGKCDIAISVRLI